MKICIFSRVVDEDKGWLPQYMAEITRLGLPFFMHFDRCFAVTKSEVTAHPLCVGYVSQDNNNREYEETDQQRLMDQIWRKGYDWAISLDIDEIFEKDAIWKIPKYLGEADPGIDLFRIKCVTLWEDEKHARIDGVFGGRIIERIYRLRPENQWVYTEKVQVGPYLYSRGYGTGKVQGRVEAMDLNFLHYGMITKEIRQMHNDRWNRIYGRFTNGVNPYKIWKHALDETITPTIVEHGLR